MKLAQVLTGIAFTGAAAMLSGCQTTSNSAQVQPLAAESAIAGKNLIVTTWNVEHLAYPANTGCNPRTPEQISKLKAYAQSLKSDIVALQEVASIQALEQLFPKQDWQLYISERADSPSYTCRKSGRDSTQQKVAYAVRKDIQVNKVSSFSPLGLGMVGLRHGLELDVNTDLGAMSVLNVHMKSGCFVDNYAREQKDACQTYAKQAPILDSWIETKEKQNTPYVVLGDFNHRLSAPYNNMTMKLTTNSDNSRSSIENTTASLIGCHPYYPAPIDHIFVGKLDSNVSKIPKVTPYENMDPKAMLSDHCAVSLQLSASDLPLSTAVNWTVESKEYAYLTKSIYQAATASISQKQLPDTSWAVVMDIDETVLNNVGYQVAIERTGQSYQSETWAAWVKSEQATLVPGVKDFIDTVLKKGGKLALITNRNRSLDRHTWRNLQALGLSVSQQNTCLMGRVAQDKTAIDHKLIVNDKDLRRQQIEAGTASCYQAEGKRHSNFSAQKIVMQVGDNIEDFAKTTQEDANIDALLNKSAKSNGSLVLLPNAMYGSW